jgi:large subunit ribosomal protein L24
MKSIKPRKQRKELFNAPRHKKRKWVAAHLEENLLLKYDKRAVSVIKGDTVKVMRGSFRGHEDKIAGVNVNRRCIEIEGLIMTKADGKKIAKPINPSNVLITKLNLTDKWRRAKLERGLSEETKKEIEKEAEEQLKEVLESEELLKAAEEQEEEVEEEASTEEIKEPITKEKPEKPKEKKEPAKPAAKTEKKTTSKAPPKKKAAAKPKAEKKPAKKKAPAKKKTVNKTSAKSMKKKEEKK